MRTSAYSKVACGLLALVAGITHSNSAMARPRPQFRRPAVVVRETIVRPRAIMRPRAIVTPVVVSPSPLYSPVYPEPVVYSAPVVYSVPTNPLPALTSVTILNPAENGATLSFAINGTRYDLSPGAKQDLRVGGPLTLEYDRGGNFGTFRVVLASGAYRFTGTDRGWTLQRDA